MSLWGPALDAEIEYRHERARQAWGARRAEDMSRRDRTERRSITERAARLRRGLEGMRPGHAAHGRHGRLA